MINKDRSKKMKKETYTAANGHTGVLIRNKDAFVYGYALKRFGDNWKNAILNSAQDIKTYTTEQLETL
jgi:hypothetical protein